MKDKTLDEPITEVVETIDLGSLEVRHVFAEELADERRSEWKEELDRELRERAKRGLFGKR
jgi:hypothetical protein